MDKSQIDEILRKTLDDCRLSRGEKRLVRDIMGEIGATEHNLAFVRHRVYEIAREQFSDETSQTVVTWLEDVAKLLLPRPQDELPSSEVAFSPDDDCARKIASKLKGAMDEVDICVFTITDNRISEAILDIHRRGTKVRIITDNDKSADVGSDIGLLRRHGVPIRQDRSEHHMHHKFAVFDQRNVLTGSYNWTRSAATSNEENFIVTYDPQLVQRFSQQFAKLWEEFG
jgi:phosphatidylserine/phosphatidylglycerophosphate/cardiolipin synthase-like enzyme